jgi:ribosomal protein S18 acetylase RimI-like enzyme
MDIRAPATEAEWTAYYDLRYRILRRPWNQPPGSERLADDGEEGVVHRAAFTPAGQLLGTGRLHFPEPGLGQIRMMAVAPEATRLGVGAAICQELEQAAFARGAKRILLEAREAAVGFYERLGYAVIEQSYLLFNSIQHYRMGKELNVI